MTDERGLTSRKNLKPNEALDDYEIDVRTKQGRHLTRQPMTLTDVHRSLDAASIRSGDVAEVWVSPDGSDDNPGTRSAPFASIQYAIDTLVERAGHMNRKRVNILSGTYYEQVIISTKFLHLKGLGQRFPDVQHPLADDNRGGVVLVYSDGPEIILSNGTQSSIEEWKQDGGLSYVFDEDNPENGYEYTGAQLDDREILDASLSAAASSSMYVTVEGISNYHTDAYLDGQGFIFLGMGDRRIRKVNIKDCQSFTSDLSIFVKNAVNISVSGFFGNTVFDNVSHSEFPVDSYPNNGRFEHPEGDGHGLLINDCINLFTPSARSPNFRCPFYVLGNTEINRPNSVAPAIVGQDRDEILYLGSDVIVDDADLYKYSPIPLISSGTISTYSAQSIKVVVLDCDTLEHNSNGTILVDDLMISENAVISDGSFIAKGGTIEGNLTVSGGSDIDLTGVHVLGDVDLTGAGDVTWRGGSFYGTLTDPDNKLGGASAGDYLNVTPA